MILTGPEIKKRLDKDIIIEPFDEKNLNPNSYNLHLNNKLLVYEEFWDDENNEEGFGAVVPVPLDPKVQNPVKELIIPKEGLVLEPGELYLGSTAEYTETHNLVPMIEGRSSWGRLGLFVHITAGFGDNGFKGCWTLEISVIRRLRIYPGVPICQVYYHTMYGEPKKYESGKYQGNNGVQPSMLWKEFQGQSEEVR